MPTHNCPECGGPMVTTKHSERLGDSPPDPVMDESGDALGRDFAAEDVEHLEEITPKRAIMVCGRCGATLAAPDL